MLSISFNEGLGNGVARARPKLRTAVIDDNPADAALLRHKLDLLEDEEISVHYFADANDGWEELKRGRFDCILLDYHLGAVDGIHLLERLRRERVDTPVIIYSGHGSESIAVNALHRGAQDYITKDDLNPQALCRAIHRAIEKVALERKLEEKVRELESFVSIVAHDLQQPLCAVRGHIDLLSDFYSDSLDEQGRLFVETASKTAKRMAHMVDALLEYSRVGIDQTKPQALHVRMAVDAAIENLSSAIHQAQVQFEIGELPRLSGFPTPLIQLFQNLIANAIKFRREAPLVITIEAAEQQDAWCISVADNARGINPRHHDEILQPFRRGPEAKGVEGSGIGLATCKKVVEQHGGRLWIESKVGVGSTFYFTLAKEAGAREIMDQIASAARWPQESEVSSASI